jgi:hypothetical protein
MAYKVVTVRLDEQDIRKLDALAEHFAKSNQLAEWMGAHVKPTRSDLIRVCVQGYLARTAVGKILRGEAAES